VISVVQRSSVVREPGDPLNVLRLWPDSNLGQLKAILPAGE